MGNRSIPPAALLSWCPGQPGVGASLLTSCGRGVTKLLPCWVPSLPGLQEGKSSGRLGVGSTGRAAFAGYECLFSFTPQGCLTMPGTISLGPVPRGCPLPEPVGSDGYYKSNCAFHPGVVWEHLWTGRGRNSPAIQEGRIHQQSDTACRGPSLPHIHRWGKSPQLLQGKGLLSPPAGDGVCAAMLPGL